MSILGPTFCKSSNKNASNSSSNSSSAKLKLIMKAPKVQMLGATWPVRMHTTIAPRFRLIRGRRKREDIVCVAATPKIVPWTTLGQTRAKMDSGMVSKSGATTKETRVRGALKLRLRPNNSTTQTNKCIIRTSMIWWTTFSSLSKMAKRTRRSRKSGRVPTKMEMRSL